VSSGAAAIDQALKTQAERELQQQAAFDSDRDRLNGQLLDALGQMAVGYEAEAASQLNQVQADHDAEATKIANALTEGKYGEATGEFCDNAGAAAAAGERRARQATDLKHPGPALRRPAGRYPEDRRPGIWLPDRRASVPGRQCEDRLGAPRARAPDHRCSVRPAQGRS
jgi:hypothetical protein